MEPAQSWRGSAAGPIQMPHDHGSATGACTAGQVGSGSRHGRTAHGGSTVPLQSQCQCHVALAARAAAAAVRVMTSASYAVYIAL